MFAENERGAQTVLDFLWAALTPGCPEVSVVVGDYLLY